MTLKDQRLVIIGGTSGIGLATAKAAAARGAQVVIGGRHYDRLEKAKVEIGGAVEGHTLDVSDEGEIKAFFEWGVSSIISPPREARFMGDRS
ncbi:MAG TPA: SDR family NAD(P)-dependent oxidoreductase [Desulfobaccales bacterium]